MKRLILALCFLIPIAIAIAQSTFTFSEWVVVNSSTATPVQLTNSNLKVRSLTLIGKKAYQTTNTGPVFVTFGDSANGNQGLTIDPGMALTIRSIDVNKSFFPSNIWVDVSQANDGLVIYYEP
jgi:hypothetical protein